jgi:hypothetical protein
MSEPVAAIIRFDGDPDDLLERFERARRRWVDAQDAGYSPPVLYAACKTDTGIAILTGWETRAAHRAFAHQIGPHLQAAGIGRPDHLEHLSIETLGCA